MGREIKFRAWDNENSIMLFDDGREQVDISFYGGKPAVIHHFTEHTTEREGIEMDVPVANQIMDFKLMQFTGLLDKNNNPIYESDIVSHSWQDLPNAYGIRREIIFNNGAFGYLNSGDNFISYAENTNFKFDETGKTENVVVLGNIYQNPELINP